MSNPPPVTGTTHVLPYHNLSPSDFERLCLWLALREGYQKAEHLGAGGSEEGRDILLIRDSRLWAMQCKRVKSFEPMDAVKEIDKILALCITERPYGIVFVTTCNISAETRKRSKARCSTTLKCEFIALTELDERVKRHRDLLVEFFQLKPEPNDKTVTPQLVLQTFEYHEDNPQLNRFHFTFRRNQLVGRETELADLRRFLTPRPNGELDFSWWVWVGPGGMGKSRLALELCLEMKRQHGWECGFLDRRSKWDGWHLWEVDRPTLVVVDYAAQRAQETRDAIIAISNNPRNVRASLRFLLIERSAEQEDLWWQTFTRRASGTESNLLWACCHQPQSPARQLLPLGEESIRKIVESIVDRNEEAVLQNNELIVNALRQIDEQRRPLFAAIAAETSIGRRSLCALSRGTTQADLIQHVLLQEFDRWIDLGVDNEHLNLLVFSTIVGNRPAAIVKQLFAAGLPVPSEESLHQLRSVTGFNGVRSVDDVAPLEPDLLGEYFVLSRLAGELCGDRKRLAVVHDTRAIVAAAWQICPISTAHFFQRVVHDFPNHLFADIFTPTLLYNPALRTAGHLETTYATLLRGIGYGSLKEHSLAISDFTAVAANEDRLHQDLRTEALLRRGAAYLSLDKINRAIEDFSLIHKLVGPSGYQSVRGLTMRASCYDALGKRDLAISDYSLVIELMSELNAHGGISPGGLSTEVDWAYASAFLNRGASYAELGQNQLAVEDYSSVIEMALAPAEMRRMALLNRADRTYEMGDLKQALSDYSSLINDANLPQDERIPAILKRGVIFSELGEFTHAISDFSLVCGQDNLQLQAMAYYNRGVTYESIGDMFRAVTDYSTVIRFEGVDIQTWGEALLRRSAAFKTCSNFEASEDDLVQLTKSEDVSDALRTRGYALLGSLREDQCDWADALNYYSQAIECGNITETQDVLTYFRRGIAYSQINQWKQAVDDFSVVICSNDVEDFFRREALYWRGSAFANLGASENAIKDLSDILAGNSEDVLVKCRALVLRGHVFADLGDNNHALFDLSATIDTIVSHPALPELPADTNTSWHVLLALAFLRRGSIQSDIGESASAVEDYSRVLHLTSLPADMYVRAMIGRGNTNQQQDKIGAAIEDYSAVINDLSVSSDSASIAYLNRGVCYANSDNLALAIEDFSQVLQMLDVQPFVVAKACFERGLIFRKMNQHREASMDLLASLESQTLSAEHILTACETLLECVEDAHIFAYLERFSAVATAIEKVGFHHTQLDRKQALMARLKKAINSR